MKNKPKFTNFSDTKNNNYRTNSVMKQMFTKSRLMQFAASLVLVLSSFLSYAQCAPKIILPDGSAVTTGVFCEGQQVKFEALSPGFTTTIDWDFDFAGDGSNVQKPTYSYSTAGNYTVTFKGTGAGGTCTETLTVIVKPSPNIRLERINDTIQCFRNNSFCFRDTSNAPDGLIVRQTYLFSNGDKIIYNNPTHYGTDQHIDTTFCITITDPTGGFFDLVIESEDSSGCVSKLIYTDYLFIHPELGIKFLNQTPAPNPGCDSTLGIYKNVSTVPLADVDSFTWSFGDGQFEYGNATTNTDWWLGPNGDGVIEHMYRDHGSFDGILAVTAYGCTDIFTFKTAVANIVMSPKILSSPNPACTPDNPITFTVQDLPSTPGIDGFLWNFGDPPSGPANTNFRILSGVTKSYGPGPWMISLRLLAGPCDVTIYDTVQLIGPGSTIEVAFDRVAQDETYQCLITDSVQMVNNSSFYQNDFNTEDEDSTVFYYSKTFDYELDNTTGFYKFFCRTWEERPRGNFLVDEEEFSPGATLVKDGYTVSWDATKDSLKVVFGGNTTYHKITYLTNISGNSYRFGVNGRKRFVFNYTPPVGSGGVGIGDQTAIDPDYIEKGYNPNVWRIWTMGDQFAPQCTTDSRPWMNKNVGINCNWSIDSVPIHWYTPWDELYERFQDGQNYTAPYQDLRLFKPDRSCYVVNIYPSNPMIVPGDTVLTIPLDSSYTYLGVNIPAGVTYPKERLGNWIVRRPMSTFYGTEVYWDAARDTFVAVTNLSDTTYHNENWLGRNNPKNGNGTTTWTVTFHEMDFYIPAGVTITTKILPAPGGGGAGVGTITTYTGPANVTLAENEQFVVSAGDSIIPQITIKAEAPDTTAATASTYPVKEIQFGVEVTVLKSKVFVDAARHRAEWFKENAVCFNIELWQKDTIHPLMCESTGTKSLALTPPNAEGLEWVFGTPCPYRAGLDPYVLGFDISNTKPGCTQQWFAVNLDTFSFPVNQSSSWTVYNAGLLAPPAPGSPIPFALPYNIVGNLGTQFVKGYTAGEIGDPYARNPFGSFALGLIIGNGTPDPMGGPPECLDTVIYDQVFSIFPIAADFTIIEPAGVPFICPGGTAYFKINREIQDNISSMRWSWGYPGANVSPGPELAGYVEQFIYHEEYTGPVAGRNDAGITYNGEDWLYNYVIRQELNDITGNKILDTIVTSIHKEWQVLANTQNADDVIIAIFEALGLNYNRLPAEDIPLYLGDGTFGCIDTSGFGNLFQFDTVTYSEYKDWGVFVENGVRYRTDSTTTPWDTIEVALVLHFRDSSLMGYDTLIKDTSGNGQMDTLTGLYKYTYRYPEVITPDDCFPDAKEIVYRNASGPMQPSLFIRSTVGCFDGTAQYLNVGYKTVYDVKNTNICEGLAVELEYYQRYWQLGEEDFLTYPIKDIPFWQEFDRYTNNIETYEMDWDSTDGVWDAERSIVPNHIYTDPGKYTITVVTKDSISCFDTAYMTVFISKLHPFFSLQDNIVNCASIIDFSDSSWIVDACIDTCADGSITPACDSIIKWEWDFGDGTRKSILENPSHNFTKGGFFDVELTVWSHLGCKESIIQRIYIPGPQPEFEFDLAVWNINDTAVICVGDSVTLSNIGQGDVNTPSFIMNWGDSTFTTPPGIGSLYSHRYTKAGTFELFLIQEDEVPGSGIRCSRIFPDTNPDLVLQHRIVVIVNPNPDVSIAASPLVVCPDDEITFTATMDDRYTRLQWIMGNSDNDSISKNVPDITLKFSYSDPGTYNVILAPEYDVLPRCWDRDTIQIEVVTIKADFDIDSLARPKFCFTDKSSANAVTYEWTFEDEPADGSSIEKDPCYNWDDRRGSFEVCLTVRTAEPQSCEDTYCEIINNTFFRTIEFFNVFTPDGDIHNNEFKVTGESIETFEMKIFNRWGERVFQTTDINTSWNGKVNNTGIKCPEGTYFYIANYKFLFGEENDGLGPVEGQVELIRNKN
ncbi:MAG: hypothetical protein COA58_12850 [Bacteroidetes bacterium]|nr:MAG: hypothetical protein COA58_12850 [Bacteroidota bacterium]